MKPSLFEVTSGKSEVKFTVRRAERRDWWTFWTGFEIGCLVDVVELRF